MSKPKSPLAAMIDACVKCVLCGKGRDECKCYESCPCGWLKEKGKKCQNPLHRKGEKR